MIRVMPLFLAFGFLLVRSVSMQEGAQLPPNAVDVKAVALGDGACSVSISKLQSEKTDDGRTLHITLKNASDFDAAIVELHFFTFAAQGQFLRATKEYVETLDLPVPAHGTKETAVPVLSLNDGDHLRVGAVVDGDPDCDASRIKKTALAEFEPADFVIVKAEGTPFTITAAQPERTDRGIPLRVKYTVEDSSPDYAADNVRVAVIAFAYTERLGGFTEAFDRTRSFVSGHSAGGVVNLIGLRPLPDSSSKWKLAVMPVEGFFGGNVWKVLGGKAGGMASAALYNARR